MIPISKFSHDHNKEYSAQAKMKGLELQALIDGAALKVGKVQEMDGRIRDVVLTDTTALEAALVKAKFGTDSLGQWFATVGNREAKLDADSALGKAGALVSVPEVIAIPTPRQLLQQTPIKRFQQTEAV